MHVIRICLLLQSHL